MKFNKITVELVDAPDNDLKIANAARVSFNKESKEFTYRKDKEKGSDEGILNFLARDDHFTPFTHVRDTFLADVKIVSLDELTEEQRNGIVVEPGSRKVRHSLFGWANLIKNNLVYKDLVAPISYFLYSHYPVAARELGIPLPVEDDNFKDGQQINGYRVYHVPESEETNPRFIDVTLRETIPIFVARQRFKHMVGFTYNEVSRRYVTDDPEYYAPVHWRNKPATKKQGSGTVILDGQEFDLFSSKRPIEYWHDYHTEDADFVYKKMLEWGVAPEQARMELPQSMMTSFYVTGSLTAFARAAKLRLDTHAQEEIREELAKQWDEIIRDIYPELWEKLIG